MALWSIFSKDNQATLKKFAQRVANKRSQSPDRWEAIKALGAMKTPEAIDALLIRFTYTTDPSITDQEEKDATFEIIKDASEMAVEPVKRFLRRAESLGWPLKLLEHLLSEEDVLGELLALVQSMDTEYERDPQRKIQVLAVLEERHDPRIGPVVERFLDDVNETTRFYTVGVLVSQPNAESYKERLVELLAKEESVRVRARILDTFAQEQWSLGTLAKGISLPSNYQLDNHGVPRKKR